MEGNKEEAKRALSIASNHRAKGNYPSALRLAQKSNALSPSPEAEALIKILEKDIKAGPAETKTEAKASGAESHPSASGVHARHPAAGKEKETRDYTPAQMATVKRVKACRHTEYYAILAVEKTCTETEVKKAYRKLALALHPDKNGAPGADEAFKMVSKAFQVLSDTQLRASFDANPTADPASRSSMSSGMRGGGMHPGFGGGGFGGAQEVSPEDLFNMFFGGGGGFGGGAFGNGGGFGGQRGPIFQTSFGGPRRQPQRRPGHVEEPQSALVSLLPILLLFVVALTTILPSIFGSASTPDPQYTFEAHPSANLAHQRTTSRFNVDYFVDKDKWEQHPIWQSVPESSRGNGREVRASGKLRQFENGVEQVYVRRLQNECQNRMEDKQRRLDSEHGVFGIGADWEKIREIKKERIASCDRLRSLGISTQY